MEIDDSDIENITVGEMYSIMPVLIIATAIAVFIGFIKSLFGFDNDNQNISFRKQYREYRKQERRIMKEYR